MNFLLSISALAALAAGAMGSGPEIHPRKLNKPRGRPHDFTRGAPKPRGKHHAADVNHGSRVDGLKPRNKTMKPRFGPDNIIGGTQSDVGEFPYYVHFPNGCGGSLITPQVVLTAAHCQPAANMYSTVNVGAYERGNFQTEGSQPRTVYGVALHPAYNMNDMTIPENDFMLLYLDEPVYLDTSVTLSLNEVFSVPADGEDLTIFGLGHTSDGGSGAQFLLDVVVPVVNTEECNDPEANKGWVIDEIMFCAGYEEGGVDTCQGDSGGPIVIRDGDNHIQVGVVSWGAGCANEGYPGVYARVSSTTDWIKDIVCGCWGSDDSMCVGHTPSSSTECPDGSFGSSCVIDYQCLSGYCDWNYECNYKVGCGDWCGEDEDCASGHCNWSFECDSCSLD